jgi:hypothetical protein
MALPQWPAKPLGATVEPGFGDCPLGWDLAHPSRDARGAGTAHGPRHLVPRSHRRLRRRALPRGNARRGHELGPQRASGRWSRTPTSRPPRSCATRGRPSGRPAADPSRILGPCTWRSTSHSGRSSRLARRVRADRPAHPCLPSHHWRSSGRCCQVRSSSDD